MATATTTRKYEEVSDRAFLAMQIVQRDGKGRDPDDVGPVDVTLRIHGVVARGEPTSQSRKSVDWESLVRVLLWAMGKREKDFERFMHEVVGGENVESLLAVFRAGTFTAKQHAEARLSDPKSRKLETNITELVEAVTTLQEFPRNGNLVGQVKVDLLAENTEASLPQAEDIARETH